jgi:hypothetical protein
MLRADRRLFRDERGERCPDRHPLPGADQELADDAVVERLDLHRRLVGVDDGHRVAAVDRGPGRDEPLQQHAGLHVGAQ